MEDPQKLDFEYLCESVVKKGRFLSKCLALLSVRWQGRFLRSDPAQSVGVSTLRSSDAGSSLTAIFFCLRPRLSEVCAAFDLGELSIVAIPAVCNSHAKVVASRPYYRVGWWGSSKRCGCCSRSGSRPAAREGSYLVPNSRPAKVPADRPV